MANPGIVDIPEPGVVIIGHPHTPGTRFIVSCNRCAHGCGEFIIGYKEPKPENIDPLNGNYICDDCVRVMSNPGDDHAIA